MKNNLTESEMRDYIYCLERKTFYMDMLIEAYEKVKILRKKYAGRTEEMKPVEDILAQMARLKLTDTTLPWHDIMDEARQKLNAASKELAK
jgi:hypothetical protein